MIDIDTSEAVSECVFDLSQENNGKNAKDAVSDFLYDIGRRSLLDCDLVESSDLEEALGL